MVISAPHLQAVRRGIRLHQAGSPRTPRPHLRPFSHPRRTQSPDYRGVPERRVRDGAAADQPSLRVASRQYSRSEADSGHGAARPPLAKVVRGPALVPQASSPLKRLLPKGVRTLLRSLRRVIKLDVYQKGVA